MSFSCHLGLMCAHQAFSPTEQSHLPSPHSLSWSLPVSGAVHAHCSWPLLAPIHQPSVCRCPSWGHFTQVESDSTWPPNNMDNNPLLVLVCLVFYPVSEDSLLIHPFPHPFLGTASLCVSLWVQVCVSECVCGVCAVCIVYVCMCVLCVLCVHVHVYVVCFVYCICVCGVYMCVSDVCGMWSECVCGVYACVWYVVYMVYSVCIFVLSVLHIV